MTTKALILTGLLVLAPAVSPALAKDCLLRGAATMPDGEPAAGVTVQLIKSGFRSSVRTVETAADGTFVLSDLPCGTYLVMPLGGTPINIDTNKRSDVALTVTTAVVNLRAATEVTARLTRDMEAARAARAARPLTPEEATDEAVAQPHRDRAMEKWVSSGELAKYRAAPPDERIRLFAQAAANHIYRQVPQATSAAPTLATGLGSIVSGFNPFRRRLTAPAVTDMAAMQAKVQDDIADAQAKAVRRFLMRHALPQDVGTFDTGSRQERIRVLLRSAREVMARQTWPSTFLLFSTDANEGVTAKQAVESFAGPDSVEAREWHSHMSPRWRGAALLRAYLVALDTAIAAAEGRVPPDADRLIANVPESQRQSLGPQFVRQAFGAAGAAEYRDASPEARRALIADAITYSMVANWMPALEM